VLAFLVVAGFLAGCGGTEPRNPSEAREEASDTGETGEQATQPVVQRDHAGEVERTLETTPEETSERMRCSEEERAESQELRIGDFEPPEEVPAYGVVEEKPVERDGAKAVRLLVDTRSRSEEDYALITRDIKSRYSELDAVGIEFTDTTGALSYNGGAVIFNTPCGVDYIGYIYSPPNNEGYDVFVPKD
jgi:hypothetical protein